MSPKIGPCVQRAPNVAACFTPVHGATGCGACHRSAPTGGAVYGTPRNARTPSAFVVPSTAPASVLTCAEAVPRPITALAIVERQFVRSTHASAVSSCHFRFIAAPEGTAYVELSVPTPLRMSHFAPCTCYARLSGVGGDGLNASRVKRSTRPPSIWRQSATARDNRAGSPRARALIIRSCRAQGDASSAPSATGSSPDAQTLARTYPVAPDRAPSRARSPCRRA